MPTKLVYHSPTVFDGVSPFDEHAVELAAEADLLITSPYISLEYLERLTSLSAQWRLLTDLPEWFSTLSQPDRTRTSAFIATNSPRVRHLAGLHAKVLVGSTGGLVGSANFTKREIQQRTEMAVYLDGEDDIRELREWFEATWEAASEISDEMLSDLNVLPTVPVKSEVRSSSFAKTPMRRARLAEIDIQKGSRGIAVTDGVELRDIIERFHPVSLDSYRMLVQMIIDHLQLDSNDARLVVTIPKRKTGWLLPVSINNRYIVAAKLHGGHAEVGVIHTPDFEDEGHGDELDCTFGRFKPLPGENDIDTPYFVVLPEPQIILEQPRLLGACLAAAEHELNRASASPHRRYHRDEAFDFLTAID